MTNTVTEGLCDSCRNFKPVVWTDSIERNYCAECMEIMPTPTSWLMLDQLVRSIPFKVGDRVECRTAGVLYDGIGVIDEISFDPAKFGTPVYPSFHVVIDDKDYPEAPDELWYTEICLRLVEQDK